MLKIAFMYEKCSYMKLITMLLLIFTTTVRAQEFSSNPPFQNWKKIDTKNYEIIFPFELESEAQRVANTLEFTYPFVGKTLRASLPKTSLLLTNKGIIPNGYVRLAPRMSEWFSSPPQSSTVSPLLGTGEWYNVLASHEIRHAFQYEKLNKGFTMVMYILLGDLGRAIMTNIALPVWVFEGDAVVTETALSNSGRGRLPSYDMEIRALELAGVRYSYYKAWLGSYKDHYPDVYHLGYLMTSYIRRNFGANALSGAIDKSGKISFWPFAFTGALKSKTKSGANATYHKTMDELNKLWKAQLENLKFTDAKIINKRKNDDWVSYYYPQYDKDGSVYAIKHSQSLPSTLVRIDKSGIEKELEQISMLFPVMKGRGNLLCWNDIGWDIRWSARNYSEIMTYNVISGKSRRITDDSKYLAPNPSSDNSKIAVVQFSDARECNLVIIDAKSGKEIKKLPNPDNYLITSPSWSDDGTQLVYIKQKNKGKSLVVFDLNMLKENELIAEAWDNITDPVFWRDYVIYGSPYSGIDNIYAINTKNGERFQLTSRKLGAFNPVVSPDGKKLLFNDYSVKGYDIAEMELNPDNWIPIANVEKRDIKYYEPIIAQEQGKNVFADEDIPKDKYPVKNYFPILHIFNVHSWTYLPSTVEPSIQVISTDILGSTNLSAGLGYNANEKALGGNVSLNYGGFFPVLSIGAGYTGRSEYGGTYEQPELIDSWLETSGNFGLTLPFNLSKGVLLSSLDLSMTGEFLHITGRENGEWNGTLFPLEYKLNFTAYRKTAERDIKPKIGAALFASLTNTPFKADLDGTRVSGQARLFIPGFFKHHSLELSGCYEWQNPIGYKFGSYFLFPRGYTAEYFPYIYKASVDYTFPIFYPDLALGQLLYMKRFRGNLFLDLGEVRNKYGDFKASYKSFGGELMLDFQLFGWSFPFVTGVRYSYKPQVKTDKVDLIFNIGY